jgi:phosphoglucomutase
MNIIEDKTLTKEPTQTTSLNLQVLIVSEKKPILLIEHLEELGAVTELFFITREDNSRSLNFKEMAPAIDYALEKLFNIILYVDVEGHKLTAAVRKNPQGKFQILTPNQLSVILANEILQEMEENEERPIFLKSLQMTDLYDTIIEKSGARCNFFTKDLNLLEYLQKVENEILFAVTEDQEYYYKKGFNRLIEFLVSLEDRLRKDDLTIFDQMILLYRQYGFYKEKTFAIDVTKDNQVALFKQMIDKLRKSPPETVGGQPLKCIEDFEKKNYRNFLTGKKSKLEFPVCNVFRLTLMDGTKITLSYSESKISYNFSINGYVVIDKDNYLKVNNEFTQKIVWYMDIINKLSS